jgi:hypothetical protein
MNFVLGLSASALFSTFVLAVYSKAGTRQTPQTLTVFSISIQQPISYSSFFSNAIFSKAFLSKLMLFIL